MDSSLQSHRFRLLLSSLKSDAGTGELVPMVRAKSRGGENVWSTHYHELNKWISVPGKLQARLLGLADGREEEPGLGKSGLTQTGVWSQ
ncbi:hypothetical protein E4U55_000008 [Claviceps digitariae]|nr:hypothetical protein E4U55_000008 [Claviceps digitariae]